MIRYKYNDQHDPPAPFVLFRFLLDGPDQALELH